MNKAQLVETLATQFDGNKRQAGHALDSVLDIITAAVTKGEKVSITGFGVFEKVTRNARTARNPRTGASVRVKKTAVPKFRPGAELKGYVSGAKKPAPKLPRATASKSAASKSTASKSAAKKSAAKKSSASKSTAKSTAKKTATKRTAAKTTSAKKAPAKKSTGAAKKTSAARKSTAKRAPARKTAAKKSTTRRSR